MAKPDSQWYRLDNAGILYSALQREEYSAIYRFSALMTEPVRPAALQNAIDRVLPRFPSFSVRIRRGLFWYYLEPNTAPGPFLKADVANPCQPVRFREDNGWLVRFYYYRNRISLEVFHALSDGAGALIFFRTLLAEYLRQTGISVPAGNGVLDLAEPPRKEELEDAYARYAGRHALGLRRMPKAYANTGTPEPFYTFHVTMGFVPLEKLREAERGNVIFGESEIPCYAPDPAMAERRLGFYARNGARTAGYDTEMFGVHYKTLYLAGGPVDDAALMEEHRFVYENTFSADKYHKYVRIPFDPKAAPGPKVPWQQ